MKIRYNRKRSINASTDKDYASLKGTDFKKAKAILEKDGFKEHEYGDKDNNNGYAVYRKGDKEVELTYKWEKGTRKDQYNAGKVLDVYVDEDINGACGKKSVKSSTRRRPVRAARTLEILTYGELTPEQQQYVLDNWSNMNKLAEVIYEWHSEDEMFAYNDEVQFIADKYANAHNLGINPDKIYWQESSQGPYPEKWELSQVFDDYSFEDVDGEWHDVEFYGRGTTVQSSCFAYDELIPEDQAIVDDITSAAQQFIDDVWQLINDICQSYPDDEWVQQTMEANPDAFEFTITADGEVKYF